MTGEGVVTLAELESYLDAVLVGGALSYRKLVDLSRGTLVLDDDQVMMLSARIRAYAQVEQLGDVAVVVHDKTTLDLLNRFLNLTSGKRTARVFASLSEAQRWLVVLPDPRTSN